MGRPPMAQPPGMATRAIPVRAISGPSTSELARMVFTISYRATGSDRVRQLMVVGSLRIELRPLHFGAHGLQQAALGIDVAHQRNVLESDLILGEDGRGHAGQR